MKPLRLAAMLCLVLSACGEERKPYQAPLPRTHAISSDQIESQAPNMAGALIRHGLRAEGESALSPAGDNPRTTDLDPQSATKRVMQERGGIAQPRP
jgi:hypothetical protein